MQILNIAGYQFIALSDLPSLRDHFLNKCKELNLKGTILLSPEGINIFLAGTLVDVQAFKAFLKIDPRFAELNFRESFSAAQSFLRMKVKIKKEIITLRQQDIQPVKKRAPSLSPQELKKWLDEGRDITLLDTRNEYEIRFGTFKNAINLHLKDFCEFPAAADKLNPAKPIVMFCTGGIRCEKAALHLLKQGFADVFQLEGGILNYFSAVGDAHFTGDCYVFDQRVAVDPSLQPTDGQFFNK